MIFDQLWGNLNDPYKDGPEGLLASKQANVALRLAKIVEYYPTVNEADVLVLDTGGGEPARMSIQVNYHGEVPGTGHSFAMHVGQLAVVAFISGVSDGTGQQGIILGVLPTRQDHWAPNHPMVAQAKGNFLRGSIDVGPDGEGNVTVVEKDKVSKVTVTAVNHEKYGPESESYGGPMKSYTEKAAADTADAIAGIVNRMPTV